MKLVDRTLNAIVVLSEYPKGVSVGELAKRLDLPVSTAHRILSALKDNGFVDQNSNDRKYRLSYFFMTIGSGISRSDSLIMAARPEMEKLSSQLDRNVILAAAVGNEVVGVTAVNTAAEQPYYANIGHRYPMYKTAAGKVFMSEMSSSELENIMLYTKQKYPDFTDEKAADLKQELAWIRQNGYAVLDGGLIRHFRAAAAPIYDQDRRIAGALLISLISNNEEYDRDCIGYLLETVYRISKTLQRRPEI